MIRTFIKVLLFMATLNFAGSARSLTIVATFDGSITNDPNAAAMEAGINGAIHALETNITDMATVYIDYVSDPTTGLGENDTWGTSYSYASYLTALRKAAADANDTNALSKLPTSSTDPVIGGNQIYLNLALSRRLNLDSNIGPDGFDSTIHLNMTLMNFTRPPTNTDDYDLQEVTEHEMDEVLGTSSSLPETSPICAADLFRYTTNLVRSFTTSGDDAYFSVDGTNLLARYNTDPNGDYGDWWSHNDVFWAPPGFTAVPQVQDAYGDPGTVQDLGKNELALLDVVGWTLAVVTPQTFPTVKIVPSGANKFTLSWSNNFTGYVLQERTNLTAGAWAFSTSGSTNPAVITSAVAQKFYRLYKAGSGSQSPAAVAAVQKSTNSAVRLVKHIYNPRPW